MKNSSLISDGIWLAWAQVSAAAGQLVGIRVLTDVLPPAVYGEFNLLLGVILLVSTGLANPSMQALLRYYPEYARGGNGYPVMLAVRRQLIRLIAWLTPVWVLGVLGFLSFGIGDTGALISLAVLAVMEVVRSLNLSVLNALQAHRRYGTWLLLDSWARPAFAWLMITQIGISSQNAITGYAIGSLLAWVLMRSSASKQVVSQFGRVDEALTTRIWSYTLPLLPLGLMGWVSGMADRYLVGGLLSVKDVGLYVAVYALASRPMLMMGQIVETTIRPAYQNALIAGDTEHAAGHLQLWLRVVSVGSIMAFAVSWYGHAWIAGLMLGEKYREASYLFPWIVCGYGLLVLSHIAGRACYANDETKKVLAIEVVGTIFLLILSPVCIVRGGLFGAALAVSASYGLRLLYAYWIARPWLASRKRAYVGISGE